jgi:hypothetical protein
MFPNGTVSKLFIFKFYSLSCITWCWLNIGYSKAPSFFPKTSMCSILGKACSLGLHELCGSNERLSSSISITFIQKNFQTFRGILLGTMGTSIE